MLKINISNAHEALRWENSVELIAKNRYLPCVRNLEMRKTFWNACWKSILAMRAKTWNTKLVMKCVLTIDVGHAREALKRKQRYGIRTINRYWPCAWSLGMWKTLKICMSHAHEALKSNISIESELKTRIRYTSKALESTYHYRIQGENENSLYQQSAWKQISL